MLISKIRIAICSLGMGVAALASAEPFTCPDLGKFVQSITEARDRGTPRRQIVQVIRDDKKFSIPDKDMLIDVIDNIYGSTSIRPTQMKDIAIVSCEKARTK